MRYLFNQVVTRAGQFPGARESQEQRNARCAGLSFADCSAGLRGDTRTAEDRANSLKYLADAGDGAVLIGSAMVKRGQLQGGVAIVAGSITSAISTNLAHLINPTEKSAFNVGIVVATSTLPPAIGVLASQAASAIYDARDALANRK